MRAFIAINLPVEIREILATQIDELDKTAIHGLRTVRPEGIHLTLKFLGEIPDTRAGDIEEALRQSTKPFRPLTLKLSEAGTFPSPESARVLWIGVAGNTAVLNRLHQSIDTSMEPLGFAREMKKFQPHLALARLNDRVKTKDRQRAADLHLSTWEPVKNGFTVGSVSLMRSELHPDGARYETLANIPFTG
ncbi:MAG: RNA 2',3'-cyclic phosphodiesterase [Chloroflexi bacterium]|nr:RNA 2',3'-cyclic phosphodiesterase [Chloroflexota bacterium]